MNLYYSSLTFLLKNGDVYHDCYVISPSDWSFYLFTDTKMVRLLRKFSCKVDSIEFLYKEAGFDALSVSLENDLCFGNEVICSLGENRDSLMYEVYIRYRDLYLIMCELDSGRILWTAVDANTGKLVDVLSNSLGIRSGKVFARLVLFLNFIDFERNN